MVNLEAAVSHYSSAFRFTSETAVPAIFKAAVAQALDELSATVRPVKGHFRQSLPDKLFRKKYDGVVIDHSTDSGPFGFVAGGNFNFEGQDNIAGIIMTSKGHWYSFQIMTNKKADGNEPSVFEALINRHIKQWAKGKIINLKGDEMNLGGISWENVAVPESYRTELESNMIFQIKNYHALKSSGLYSPRGIVLAGEPGMGKTLAGKVIAREAAQAGATVIMTNPGELTTLGWDYAFKAAGYVQPTLIFFEDAETAGSSDHPLMYAMADHLDGLSPRNDVMLLATTNELDKVDPRIKRPGRIDRVLEFNPQKAEFGQQWREEVVAIHLNGNREISADPQTLAAALGGYHLTGAQLGEIIKSATIQTLNGYEPTALGNGPRVMLTEEAIREAVRTVQKTYGSKRPLGESFRPKEIS